LVHFFPKIMYLLIWPVIVIAVIIVSFAQMFYTLLVHDCETSAAQLNVCTVRDAYRVVFTFMNGELSSIPDGATPWSDTLITLVSFLLFFRFIAVVGTAIIVLIGVSSLSWREIAHDFYWEPKLSFVLSINQLGCLPAHNSLEERYTARFNESWNLLFDLVRGVDLSNQHSWYLQPKSKYRRWLLTAIAFFLIPLWILAGLISMGLLWPPQARRMMFMPFGTNRGTATTMGNVSNVPCARFREEFQQLKEMSHANAVDLQRDIRELKEMLLDALKED
jgi:hypothetical protein